jgi:hypothetical protein
MIQRRKKGEHLLHWTLILIPLHRFDRFSFLYNLTYFPEKPNAKLLHTIMEEQTQRLPDSPFTIFVISWQAFTSFPILLLAQSTWLREAARTVFGFNRSPDNTALEIQTRGLQYPYFEKAGIILHRTWILILYYRLDRFSFLYSLAYFIIATYSSEFLLAIIFELRHKDMSTYDTDASKINLQRILLQHLEHNIVQCYLLQQDMQLKYMFNFAHITSAIHQRHIFPIQKHHNGFTLTYF